MAWQFAFAAARRMVLAAALFVLSADIVTAAGMRDSIMQSLSACTMLLDASLSDREAAASPYLFNDVRQALGAVADGTEEQPMRLYIAPGVYWVDDPDDPAIRQPEQDMQAMPYGMTVRCEHLHLIGLGQQPDDVVLACNRGQTQGANGNFTMLHIMGDDIQARNITFGNYCNVDLVYPLDHSKDRPRRADAIVQAQLVHVDADRVYCDNCRFISRLNLCPMTGARRALYKDCHFESTDDALAGSAVYLHCHFTFFSSKPWYSTPAWGAVLLDCDIDTHTRRQQYFTKTGGGIAVIDTRIRTAYDDSASPLAIGWSPYGDVAACYQSNVTLNGHPVAIGSDSERNKTAVAQRSDITDRRLLDAFKVWVSDEEAVYNIPNLLAGDDGWDPLGLRPVIERAEQELDVRLLGLPTLLKVIPNRQALAARADTAQLSLSLRRWGNYDASAEAVAEMEAGGARWLAPTTLQLLTPGGGHVIAVSHNDYANPVQALVTASYPSGLKALTHVDVAPYLRPAPTFASSPILSYDAQRASYTADYQLSLAEGDDTSLITWYRYTRDDLSDTIAVRCGTPAQGLATYRLGPGDVGYKMAVRVVPRRAGTRAGRAQAVRALTAVQARALSLFNRQDARLTEDFSTLPVQYQPRLRPGFWTLDGYKPLDTYAVGWEPRPRDSWYYGTATDGAIGKGLVQRHKGARLFYTPVRLHTGDMTVTVKCDPCKTGGQGFGSATAQYLDIYIKFDPTTLTGYALRIERSPNYDRAVLFTLMQYANGVATPLTQPQPSSCFRSTCTLTLSLRGTQLSATAWCDEGGTRSEVDSQLQLLAKPNGVSPRVSLQATVDRNDYGGIGLQHTGSTGASATMIHLIDAVWR